MTAPLWFLVRQRKFGYKEFLDRFTSPQSDENYTAPLFTLLTVNQIEPYIEDEHVLSKLTLRNNVSSRTMSYYFLYWILAPNFKNDPLDTGNPHIVMGQFQYQLNAYFSRIFEKTVDALLQKFFGINLTQITEDDSTIPVTMKFLNLCRENLFSYSHYSMSEVKHLFFLYKIVLQIKDWLLHLGYPPWIEKARTTVLVQNNSPTLVGISHLDLILESLKSSDDYEFLEYMVNQLTSLVPSREIEIKDLLSGSPEIDLERINRYIDEEHLSPSDLMYFIPLDVPVLDHQVEEFLQMVGKNGIEKTLRWYIEGHKRYIQNMYHQKIITNEVTLVQMESIYSYSTKELIFVTSGKTINVFTEEDLRGQVENPYNRQALPIWLVDHIQTSIDSETRSTTYMERWSSILKRPIKLTERLPIIDRTWGSKRSLGDRRKSF